MNNTRFFSRNRRKWLTILAVCLGLLTVVGVVYADVPGGRLPPRGTVPNPGTQEQELANITAPAPYNVFEFVVTCAACHGGTIDQQAGHFGNWSGSSMASAARDPIFRANQIGVELATGNAGAGNMCFRCHSPNGWYSGRFDPTLAGEPTGSNMIHSIVLSTDDEGILCEFCHRTMGNVTFQRADLDPADPVWNMLLGVTDWPHQGDPYLDQDGDPTIGAGNPYGDTTLQVNDGMTYIGKYSGSVDLYFSDLPMIEDPLNPGTWIQGGNYTGQTYAVYPPAWTGPKAAVPDGEPQFDPAGNEIAYNVDGSLGIQFEAPIGPPIDPTTEQIVYDAQGLSLEHPTVGDRPGLLPQPVPSGDTFLRSSEFCGSCHDLTVPVLNHGMPEQRTYTEWLYSDFGDQNVRCQDCHMPTMVHEYADDAQVSLNPDPTLAGWWPYAKDRTAQGGTAFHKFGGANRDLPMMMKELYPEVDLEVIGAPTGNDTRIFPGMLSHRDPMYDRNQRNSEIMLLEAVDVEILGDPVYDAQQGRWTVDVQVTNNSGHRIPSGYPDGRRFWIELHVTDEAGATVYESGYYDPATAELYTDSTLAPFNRALEPAIDSAANAVMVYERVTGECVDTTGDGVPDGCTPSPSLLNHYILFDNRLLPAGFKYQQLREAGVKFWNYDPATFVPYEDAARFPNGFNYDVIQYTFDAPADAVLNVRAEAYWQTHTREFMEHLRTQDVSTLRPEGPPDILDPNYPLNPTYLSEVIDLAGVEADYGVDLNDNWGGIAYAAWLLTGQGAPYLVAADDSLAAAPPAAPLNVYTLLLDPFTAQIGWDPVAGADGYQVWIRYGVDDTGATAAWDRLAVVYDDGDPLTPLQLTNTAMNVAKTYAVKVQAFNGAGFGPDSAVVVFTTPTDLPLPPENLKFVSSTGDTIAMSWFDVADNEDGFVIERQDVPPVAFFTEIARIPSQTAGGGTGGNFWTDTGVLPGRCYNYRVAAYNVVGMSTFNVNGPIQMCTTGTPGAPANLTAVAIHSHRIDLAWDPATGTVDGYRIERSLDGGLTWGLLAQTLGTQLTYSDLTVAAATTYWYRVFAFNGAGDSLPSNVASATTPADTPAAPSGLTATPSDPSPLPPLVTLEWLDNAVNEDGFVVERALDNAGLPGAWTQIAQIAAPAPGSGTLVAYIDSTVEPKMTYWYRVAAYNAAGTSPYSNEVSVVTPGQIPEAPADLRVVRTYQTSIQLSWTDKSTNEQGFYLYMSTDGVNFSRVATLPANTTSYRVNGLARKTTYYFYVTAYNADGESAPSNTVTGRTK